MSIEGIANYEHVQLEQVRPVWERLERMEYCNQDLPGWTDSFLGKLKKLFERFR